MRGAMLGFTASCGDLRGWPIRCAAAPQRRRLSRSAEMTMIASATISGHKSRWERLIFWRNGCLAPSDPGESGQCGWSTPRLAFRGSLGRAEQVAG